jgi:hypothetical protein
MFFIYNCKGEIVGNSKGYKTHKGAERQCTTPGRIRSDIYSAFFDIEEGENPYDTLLYSIKWKDMPKSEAMRAFNAAFNNPVEFMKKHFTVINIQ